MSRRQILCFGVTVINFLVLIVLAWVHAVAGPLGGEFIAVSVAHFAVGAVAALGILE